MTVTARGRADLELADEALDELFSDALNRALGEAGGSGPVLILPPDITRYHSRAGFLTDIAVRELSRRGRLGLVLPALGTHFAMGPAELRRMFPGTPPDRFRVHDWRRDVVELGRLEAEWVGHTGGVYFDWPVQVNRMLRDGGFSLILSIGQVVPHEVAGMANHSKNILVGTGGKEAIDKSHFVGARYGLERLLGRIDNPVRALFDEGLRRFGHALPPILWALTVVGSRGPAEAAPLGAPVVRGLYIGFGRDCFEKAAALAREVNLDLLDEPVEKAVVYLDGGQYRTTWLGNKAIYRTRMAIADGGELLILAPGLQGFGEDPALDALIRRYGYRSGAAIRDLAEKEPDLAENLSVAAHLIHGSPEGRFTVRYCPGPGLSRNEIEAAGYAWGDLDQALKRYAPNALRPGKQTLPDGETIFFIPNPSLGLWAEKKRFFAAG
ncbi:lactate racemase domain-containing protein [Treponema sp. TIM-1]|uniref:lactate racemase domain-containing protein n=1 Tax=Treponema sp. TIM-1 TaxID=2898417 RepID=UPI00398149BB